MSTDNPNPFQNEADKIYQYRLHLKERKKADIAAFKAKYQSAKKSPKNPPKTSK